MLWLVLASLVTANPVGTDEHSPVFIQSPAPGETLFEDVPRDFVFGADPPHSCARRGACLLLLDSAVLIEVQHMASAHTVAVGRTPQLASLLFHNPHRWNLTFVVRSEAGILAATTFFYTRAATSEVAVDTPALATFSAPGGNVYVTRLCRWALKRNADHPGEGPLQARTHAHASRAHKHAT